MYQLRWATKTSGFSLPFKLESPSLLFAVQGHSIRHHSKSTSFILHLLEFYPFLCLILLFSKLTLELSKGSQGPRSNNSKWLGREFYGSLPALLSNISTQREWKEKNRAPWRQESLKTPFLFRENKKVLFMTFTTRFGPPLKNNKEFGISA